MESCKEWYPLIGMVSVELAFATINVLFKEMLNQDTNQLLIVIYRQSIAAIFLAPIAYFLERKERPMLTASILFHLFFSALFGVALSQYFFLIGLKYTSATFMCAFINMVPINTFIMALPFGLEKVNIKSKSGKAKVLGALISISGVLVLTLYKGTPLPRFHSSDYPIIEATNTTTKKWAIGSIFLGLGSLMWSSWFLFQERISKSYPCPYSTTSLLSLFSALQSIILRFIVDGRKVDSTWILKGKFKILSVLYAGVVGSGLCYVVMSWCVKRRGPVFTAAFCPLIQAFVAIFDIFILHEQLYFGSVLGSSLVIIGMYSLLWGKSHDLNNSVIKQAPTVVDHQDP